MQYPRSCSLHFSACANARIHAQSDSVGHSDSHGLNDRALVAKPHYCPIADSYTDANRTQSPSEKGCNRQNILHHRNYYILILDLSIDIVVNSPGISYGPEKFNVQNDQRQ